MKKRLLMILLLWLPSFLFSQKRCANGFTITTSIANWRMVENNQTQCVLRLSSGLDYVRVKIVKGNEMESPKAKVEAIRAEIKSQTREEQAYNNWNMEVLDERTLRSDGKDWLVEIRYLVEQNTIQGGGKQFYRQAFLYSFPNKPNGYADFYVMAWVQAHTELASTQLFNAKRAILIDFLSSIRTQL